MAEEPETRSVEGSEGSASGNAAGDSGTGPAGKGAVRTGIVVVSHSRALADAALGLAQQMVQGEQPPTRVAAGMADGGFGTDAAEVSEALDSVANDLQGSLGVSSGAEVAQAGGGVVVFTDLGSAVLSAEMATEFVADPDLPTRIVPAAFVEGLLAAVVSAAGGAGLDEVAGEAAAALAPKREQLGADEGGDGRAGGGTSGMAGASANEAGATAGGVGAAGSSAEAVAAAASVIRDVTLVNATGLHARPAAQLAQAAAEYDADVKVSVPGRSPASAGSPLALAGLGTRGGDTVTLTGSGDDAEPAVDALATLIAGGFGETEDAGDTDSATDSQAAKAAEEARSGAGGGDTSGRHGTGVSPGRVVGPVARMAEPLPAPDDSVHVEDDKRDGEVKRVFDAAQAVAEQLQRRAGSLKNDPARGDAAQILEATAQLATDPGVLDSASGYVKDDGLTAPAAAWKAYGQAAESLKAVGGLTAERATDVLDVRGRVVASLEGVEPPGVPDRDEPFVLVARALAPADTAAIDPSRVLAIVSDEGGPTSHMAILAKTLGIPAVVGATGTDELVDGQQVLVDGDSGELIQDPSDQQIDSARTEPQEQHEAPPLTGPVTTADGRQVEILANIGGPKDVNAALASGAEGVGLFRTEFLFLNRTEAPSLEEQAELYTEVFEGFAGKKVVIRTLDAGSDKPLPFLQQEDEENPALGIRGLRTAWDHEEVLTTQLRAIAAAAARVPTVKAWTMAPMVATADEAKWFANLAHNAGLETVGVMVETPAAAVCSEQIFEHVDFVSIGTNDLAQYTMGADRLSAKLAHLNDPWQPAVLRMIKATVDGSGGKPVGVCGEAAADPKLAKVLVGLGVTSLSMNPAFVPRVGEAVADATRSKFAVSFISEINDNQDSEL